MLSRQKKYPDQLHPTRQAQQNGYAKAVQPSYIGRSNTAHGKLVPYGAICGRALFRCGTLHSRNAYLGTDAQE